MAHEEKPENHGEYDENDDSNTSSRKRYYDSISDKRSSSRERSRKRSRRDRSYSSSRSRSPAYKRIRYHGTRENPNKSRVLGVFGLSSRTSEDDLADIFSRYGKHDNTFYEEITSSRQYNNFIKNLLNGINVSIFHIV